MTFNPCDFGDPYTKKTGLWGKFNVAGLEALKTPVDPIKSCKAGSHLMKLGGNREKTKEIRSITPSGFADAFYAAHNVEPWNLDFLEKIDRGLLGEDEPYEVFRE